MVWAAEFVRALGDDLHSSVAVRRATTAVLALRDRGTNMLARAGDHPRFIEDARVMLDDMLSTGADR
jgi:hypothetical protein